MEDRTVLGDEPAVFIVFGGISDGIDPNEYLQDPDVREAVRWCSLDSVKATCETTIRDRLARRRWDDLDDLDAAIERAIADVEQPGVRSTLPEESSFRCVIDYRGAFAYWDLPSDSVTVSNDLEAIEDYVAKSEELPVIDRENDPPIASVWN